MSAAPKFERREKDFYPSPSWTVDWLLPEITLPGGLWVEPGAGDGALIRAVNAHRRDVNWLAVELDDGRAEQLRALPNAAVFHQDFLALPPLAEEDFAKVGFGNPPFNLAEEFVRHTRRMAHHVVFLLRLAFLETKGRRALFAEVGMPDVYVLEKRPPFAGGGQTDNCAYAWMHWPPVPRKRGLVARLNPPPQPDLLGGAS